MICWDIHVSYPQGIAKTVHRGKTPSLATSETPASDSQMGREDAPLFRKRDSSLLARATPAL